MKVAIEILATHQSSKALEYWNSDCVFVTEIKSARLGTDLKDFSLLDACGIVSNDIFLSATLSLRESGTFLFIETNDNEIKTMRFIVSSLEVKQDDYLYSLITDHPIVT